MNIRYENSQGSFLIYVSYGCVERPREFAYWEMTLEDSRLACRGLPRVPQIYVNHLYAAKPTEEMGERSRVEISEFHRPLEHYHACYLDRFKRSSGHIIKGDAAIESTICRSLLLSSLDS